MQVVVEEEVITQRLEQTHQEETVEVDLELQTVNLL
jgi:hypothetical protein